MEITKPPQFEELWGKIDTFDSAPTYVPRKVSEQLCIVGTTLYIYNFVTNAWFKCGLSFVEVTPPAVSSPAANNVWETWDLSATIPAGAEYVEVVVRNIENNSNNGGTRINGGTITRLFTLMNYADLVLTTKLDSNRIIERRTDDKVNVDFTVTGYWI